MTFVRAQWNVLWHRYYDIVQWNALYHWNSDMRPVQVYWVCAWWATQESCTGIMSMYRGPAQAYWICVWVGCAGVLCRVVESVYELCRGACNNVQMACWRKWLWWLPALCSPQTFILHAPLSTVNRKIESHEDLYQTNNNQSFVFSHQCDPAGWKLCG